MLAFKLFLAWALWTGLVQARPGGKSSTHSVSSTHSKPPSHAATKATQPKGKAAAKPTSAQVAAPTKPVFDCDDGTWKLTKDNYLHFETDKNLRTWWAGGQNGDGPLFQPQPKNDPDYFLTYALAGDYFPTGYNSQFFCTLEAGKCNPPDGCNNFSFRNETGDNGDPIHWGWFATYSISTLSSFVNSFYQAFQNAGIQFNFNLLDLTDTFTKPSKNPQILTKDLLIGFSFLISTAFSLVPIAGPIADSAIAAGAIGALGSAAGGTLSAANGIFSNSLSTGAPLEVKAKDFGKYMGTVWNQTGSTIDSLVTNMMSGKTMDGPIPLLLQVLAGGVWADPSAIVSDSVSLTSLTRLIYNDLLQRGINHIWHQSKIWVSYADLNDDATQSRCKGDTNGWQASKYCADGGVYYLYRFDEDGNEDGHLDYPWGADKMADDPYNLNPSWVSESSAMAYRSQNNKVGGFSFDYSKQPSNLQSLLQSAAKKDQLAQFHVLAGTWDIPVCDMGTHSDWNTDFTQDNPTSTYGKFAFPCCCGPNCSQTKDFVAAAQMNNFDTIVSACKSQLKPCDAWPAGVTEIDFGDAGSINKDDNSGTC